MGIGRHYSITLSDFFAINFDQVFLIRVEGVYGLICQYISIGQKQDTRPARTNTVSTPARLKYFMDNLKGNKGFTGACSQGQQNSCFSLANSICGGMNKIGRASCRERVGITGGDVSL